MGSAEWSAVHEGLRRLRMYSCRWVGGAVFCCWCLSHYAAGSPQQGFNCMYALARPSSVDFISSVCVCVCVCVCCFLVERLGWTSMSTYRPLASFLAMCVMDGLVLAQEDSKCLRLAFRPPTGPYSLEDSLRIPPQWAEQC